jgi:hypothetical protein
MNERISLPLTYGEPFSLFIKLDFSGIIDFIKYSIINKWIGKQEFQSTVL